jgi:hypothetical protein
LLLEMCQNHREGLERDAAQRKPGPVRALRAGPVVTDFNAPFCDQAWSEAHKYELCWRVIEGIPVRHEPDI